MTLHTPVAEEGLFLHQRQLSTGIMYIFHIFLWRGSMIRHYTSRTTFFHVFSNFYPTALIYHMLIPAVISMCVAYIHGPTYMHMERAWGWGRHDHFSQRYFFCLHTWRDMYVLYIVCLCGGAQGQEGFIRTKQKRTPVFECSWSRAEVWKPRLVMPGILYRVWYIAPVCYIWCIIRKRLYSYERILLPVRDT